MVTELNWASIIVNGGLVAGSLTLSGWLLKRWMTGIEDKHDRSVAVVSVVAETTAAAVAQVARDTAAAVAVVARDTAQAVAQVAREAREETYRMTMEVKDGIKSNRAEYIRVSTEIKGSVDVLAGLQRDANGRTGKIEGAVREIGSRCEERSKAFYTEPEKKSKKVKCK